MRGRGGWGLKIKGVVYFEKAWCLCSGGQDSGGEEGKGTQEEREGGGRGRGRGEEEEGV